MHSAPRGAFAAAPSSNGGANGNSNGGGIGGTLSPTSAAAALPSYVRWQQLSAAEKQAAWMEANPYLLGRPDPRWGAGWLGGWVSAEGG